MILERLAAAPHLPPVLHAQLLAHATATPLSRATPTRDRTLMRGLRKALAANPATTPDQVHTLTRGVPLDAGRTQILTAALCRPGLTPKDAIEILGQDHSTGALLLALEQVHDPDGHLAQHAYQVGTGAQLWAALLTHRESPLPLRWEVATALATTPAKHLSTHTLGKVVAAVTDRLTWATTPAQHRAATTWAKHLRSATPFPHLAQALADLDIPYRPAQVGSRAWLTNPDTDLDQVIDWANRTGDHAWATAIAVAHDPHRELPALAQATCPGSTKVAGAVRRAALRRVGAPARQRALLDLLADGEQIPVWELVTGATTGHPDLAVQILSHAGTATGQLFAAMLTRDDLSPDHLDAVVDAAPCIGEQNAGTLRLLFGLWLATYPTARPDHRALGRQLTSDAHATAVLPNLGPVEQHLIPLAAHTTDLDPGDPQTVVRLGRHLPLPGLLPPGTMPGILWLLRTTVAHHLGTDTTSEAISVLATLSDTFTGTLGELLDVTTTIATTHHHP